MTEITRADICVVACAEAWRGDGEIFASGMGTIQMLGVRLARATFEPDLLISDGEAFFVAGNLPLGGTDKVVEGWIPFRSVFDTLWSGRRHVMMGASQIDRFGNTNISVIGPWAQPKTQLLGVRGGPGNTVNHATSFFVPKHTAQVFTAAVDMASGLGYDRAAGLGRGGRFHRIPRIVTNLAVLDFETSDHRMRLASVHPGVSVEEVVANTGFGLAMDGGVAETRQPTDEDLAVLAILDPKGIRHREVN